MDSALLVCGHGISINQVCTKCVEEAEIGSMCRGLIESEVVLEFVSPAYDQNGNPGVAFFGLSHEQLFVIPQSSENAARELAAKFVTLFLGAIRRVDIRRKQMASIKLDSLDGDTRNPEMRASEQKPKKHWCVAGTHEYDCHTDNCHAPYERNCDQHVKNE